jgi:hypothetical protein
MDFVEVSRLSISDSVTDALLELSPLDLEAVYIERDGVRIELLWYREPGHVGDGSRREMNRLGLTHIALRIGDIDRACRRIEEAGGQVLEDTAVVFPVGSRGIIALDPDGTRLELIERVGAASSLVAPPRNPSTADRASR